MTLEELRELFSDMLSKGLQPMYCDTIIPLYESPVPCGEPNVCHEDLVHDMLFPRELLSMHPEMVVCVTGDSMIDAGIAPGDKVRVQGDVMPQDGDILLVRLDGEYTIKCYFVDEQNCHWLVPQNEKYQPILLDEQIEVMIVGRITEVMKQAPRISSRDCLKAIRRWKLANIDNREVSPLRVSQVVREIAPLVKKGRQWYAVYRAMADVNVMKENDFDVFCDLIRTEVPKHSHLPKTQEMQRMASFSFAKPVSRWLADNAPVKGKIFADYKNLAKKTRELLES